MRIRLSNNSDLHRTRKEGSKKLLLLRSSGLELQTDSSKLLILNKGIEHRTRLKSLYINGTIPCHPQANHLLVSLVIDSVSSHWSCCHDPSGATAITFSDDGGFAKGYPSGFNPIWIRLWSSAYQEDASLRLP